MSQLQEELCRKLQMLGPLNRMT